MRSAWFPAHRALRTEDHRTCPDREAGDSFESILRKLPGDLDRRAGTAERSRAAMERILRRKVGGRLHVRGRDGGPESEELDRSRRTAAQRGLAGGGTLSPRGP